MLNFRGLIITDSFEYASIARNIMQGKGYQTNITAPIFLLRSNNNYFSPLHIAPLHPYVLSLFFLIGGISDKIVAVNSGFFYIMTVIPVYLFAWRIWGRLAGITCVILLLFEPNWLCYSISGLTEPLFIFMLTSAIAVFYLLIDKDRKSLSFLLGCLCGIARLARLNIIVFLPSIIFAFFVLKGKKAFKSSALFLLGFLILALPEMVRNYMHFGDPIFAGNANAISVSTPQFPGLSVAGTLDLAMGSVEYILTYPKWFIEKYVGNLYNYLNQLFIMTNPFIFAFFITSLFSVEIEKKITSAKLVIIVAIIIQAILLASNVTIIRYFHIFIPFIIIFAVGHIIKILQVIDNGRLRKTLGAILMITLAAPLLYKTIVDSYMGYKYNNKNVAISIFLSKLVRDNIDKAAVVASNLPALGWYGERKYLSLPVSLDVFNKINDEILPLQGLLLVSDNNFLEAGEIELTGISIKMQIFRELLFYPVPRIGNLELIRSGEIYNKTYAFYKVNKH